MHRVLRSYERVVFNFTLTVGNFLCSALFTYPLHGTNAFKIQNTNTSGKKHLNTNTKYIKINAFKYKDKMQYFAFLNTYLYFKLQLHPCASPAGGQRGQCPLDFCFCPPDFFLALPRCFFGRKKLVFLGGKNVKICDFGQKKPSDFGEDLFFFLFRDHLLLVGKFVISARKSLRISAKTFAPLILILPPRSREAGDAPDYISSLSFGDNFHCSILKDLSRL